MSSSNGELVDNSVIECYRLIREECWPLFGLILVLLIRDYYLMAVDKRLVVSFSV